MFASGGGHLVIRSTDGAGQHPQGRNEVEDAHYALRPGAAGLKGSDAHPISGSATTINAIGPAQPWPDLRSSEQPESAKRIRRSAAG